MRTPSVVHPLRAPSIALAVALLLLIAPTPASGAKEPLTTVPWFQLLMGLFGGLALFLYGMERMGESLKEVAGERLRHILGRLSNNRIMGLLTGAGVTAVIQSSSVTTVMLVGFVSANLMSLAQSVGVILGADIGTTITAQIVAFKVTKYALLLVAVGFAALFASKQQQVQRYGYMVMGLGLIFFGMSVMSDAMRPLRAYEPFLTMMQSIESPIQGILLAAAFTALIQSSSATMGIVIVLAMQGLISLEGGIALALGANIGTCATAGLAAIGKPREAVRVAVAHVLFKIVGVVLILPFISYFAEWVVILSPGASEELSGQALRAAIVPRQVANAHTFFNVGIAFLFLPLTGPFARIVTWLVKDRPLAEAEAIAASKYLDPILLKTPALAMDAVRHEISRVGKRVLVMLRRIPQPLVSGNEQELEEVRALDEEVDQLYGQIVIYLGMISRDRLSRAQTSELMNLMTAANDLETVGDIIENELVAVGLRRIREEVTISEPTQDRIMALHALVYEALAVAVRAVTDDDKILAASVLTMKAEVAAEHASAQLHQAERLVADEPKRLQAYSLEVDLIDRMTRIHYHTRRLAKTVAGPQLLVRRPTMRLKLDEVESED